MNLPLLIEGTKLLKMVCSRVEYAAEPIDELFEIHGVFHDVKVFDILDWLAFTSQQITTLPCDFYLGLTLSILVK